MIPAVMILGALLQLPPDPVPVARQVLPANSPVPPGTRPLPLAEFETLLRRLPATSPPRLTIARYTASLRGTSLVGTGTFSTSGTGRLPLDPLRLALHHVRSITNAEIVVERPATLTPAAILELAQPGDVLFDWSLRSTEEPGELRFDLRTPPAPVAELELTLPATRTPIVNPAETLLTGPFPGPKPDEQRYRLRWGGNTTRWELILRDGNPSSQPPPLVRASQEARYELTPTLAFGAHDLECESLRGPIDQLECVIDARLQVQDVTGPFVARWQQEQDRLRITFRESWNTTRISIAGQTEFRPGADPEPWTVPAVRLQNGVPQSETIDVRTGPEGHLDSWSANDFRLVSSTSTADRGYQLRFAGQATAVEGAPRQRPTLRATLAAPEVRTQSDLVWTIEPGRSRLEGQFDVRVLRGPLARLVLQVPPGFTPERWQVQPDDPTLTGTPAGPDQWALEFPRPLATGQQLLLTVTLRGPPGPSLAIPGSLPALSPTARLPLPRFGPRGGPRDGRLRIVPAPAYEAFLVAPARDTLSMAFLGQEPSGALLLRSRPALISARLEANTLTVQSRQEVDFNSLTLSTAIGAVPTLTEGTARRVPLGLFPAGLAPAPFLTAALALQPPMETWQLRFPRPLHEVEIRFAAPLVVPPVVHGATVLEVPAPQQSAGRPRPDEAPLELIRPSLQARVQPDGQMVRITSGRVRTVGGGILPLDS
ncbi:MAG: hypothetical protein ACRCZF_07310, partial [Gemmataceae bacterium]